MLASGVTLALKYRPKRFEDLIAQDSIRETLSISLDNDRLSSAYLFSGLRGSGKTSTARIFSKSLVCESGPTSKPCETCSSCQMANENRHIDIIEVDAASHRKIDDIRDIIEQTKYKPSISKYKIFIIDEVHMLTKEAFNAFLKTLEEPPNFVKFILATTDPIKLPATIISRTMHFRFKIINSKSMLNHLTNILNKENIEFEEDGIRSIVRAAKGSLRDAITILDQAIIHGRSTIKSKSVSNMLGFLDTKKMENLFDLIIKSDKNGCYRVIEEIADYDCENIIDDMISFLKERFFKRDNSFTLQQIDRYFRVLNEAKSMLFLNADSSFVLMLMFLKMIEANKIKTIDNLINELLSSESKASIQETSIQNKIFKEQESMATDEKKVADEKKDPFKRLIDKIYDRNYELGKIFEENIRFISYEDNKLTWASKANKKLREKLSKNYNFIKTSTKEVFGINTTIINKKEQEGTTENIDAISHNTNNKSTSDIISSNSNKNKKDDIAKPKSSNEHINNISNDPNVIRASELFMAKNIVVVKKKK